MMDLARKNSYETNVSLKKKHPARMTTNMERILVGYLHF